MLSILLICNNVREKQILKTAFEQIQFKVQEAEPTYGSYVKVIQYLPDVILMELPRLCTEQVSFIEMLKKHKKARLIPLVCYGDPVDKSIARGIQKKGADEYLERPLKFSNLLKVIAQRLKLVNKQIEAPAAGGKSDRDTDMDLILNPNTLRTQKIDLMVKHIGKLMAFPFTVAKVLQLAESEKSGATDLAKILEADPVISANILKVSNTVFFASATRRINSIKDAIVRIGFKETKRIVMSMSVMDLFNVQEQRFGFNRIHFWYHCLGTALIAEDAARRVGDINPEEAFLAGLLHDFGILLLDEFYPSIFSRILEATAGCGGHFVDQELEILDITHIDLMSQLFTSWKLPDVITEAIGSHYSIHESTDRLDTPGKKLALCVSIGNNVAKTFCLGAACDQFVVDLPDFAFQKMKLPHGYTAMFEKETTQNARVFCKFLKLDDDQLPEARSSLLGDRLLAIGLANPGNAIFIAPETYLKTQGHTLTRMPRADNYLDAGGKFDLIIIWLPSGGSVKDIEPFTRIVQRQPDNGTISLVPPAAPVLVFVGEQFDRSGVEGVAGLSLMPCQYDQRQLDITLLEILQGKKVITPAP